MSTSGGTKAVVAALAANTSIAITKFLAFLLTGFSSMLAESIHSLADAGNQVLLLVGGKRSRREATPEHPFGFGRDRYIYAFVVAIVLFSIGGLFSLNEAYHKFHEIQAGGGMEIFDSRWRWVPVVVLVIAIGLESASFRTAIIEGNRDRNGRGWWEYIRSAKAPELPVILLEDFAALVGMTLALGAVGLSLITENPLFDVIGTGLIGILLVVVAIVLAIEVKSLLVGESATPSAIAALRSALESTDGVGRIIHMKTLHTAPEELLVAVKIGIDATDTGAEVADIIDRAEQSMRAAEAMAVQIFIEPDIHRADYEPQRDAAPDPEV